MDIKKALEKHCSAADIIYDEVEKLINKKGRALLRQSGTEPVIRIMIESESDELCHKYADMIADVIIAKGHLAE